MVVAINSGRWVFAKLSLKSLLTMVFNRCQPVIQCDGNDSYNMMKWWKWQVHCVTGVVSTHHHPYAGFFAWTFLSQPYLQGTYFPLLLRGRRQHCFVIEALFINAHYIFLNSTFHLFTLNLEYKLEYSSLAVRAIQRASRWRYCKAGTTKRFTNKQWYNLLAGIHCSKLHMCVHYVCIHMMHTSLGQKNKILDFGFFLRRAVADWS